MRKVKCIGSSLFLLLMGVLMISCAEKKIKAVDQSGDLRRFQHGIDFVKKSDGSYILVWSSQGNPPVDPGKEGDWNHDIFYSNIDPQKPSINPIALVSRKEAQEPASSAISSDGHIMITSEDGENGLNQMYAVYKEDMSVVKSYPQMVARGGHSGHVAAVDNYFCVFWSDKWDDSVLGADGIGVGKEVLLSVYNSVGDPLEEVEVSVEDTERNWWPVIAGSKTNACMVWQRYTEDDQTSDMYYAVYNPKSKKFTKEKTKIAGNVKYYTFDVQYMPNIDRFLIIGTYYTGGGFAYLVDNSGRIVNSNKSIPTGVREMQPAIREFDEYSFAVYPCSFPNGIFVLKLTSSAIELKQVIPNSVAWSGVGTDGIFINDTMVYIVNESPFGLQHEIFTIGLKVSKKKEEIEQVSPVEGQLIGFNGEGTTVDECEDDIDFNRFKATADGKATRIRIKAKNAISGKVSCAIYADNNGKIGTKLAVTEEKSDITAGWNELVLKKPQQIKKEEFYYLVVWSNDVKFKMCAGPGEGLYTGSLKYPNWPQNAPADLEDNETQYCIYAIAE